MVIPNMVMKFHNVDIFYKTRYIFDMLSALACRVESINQDPVRASTTFALIVYNEKNTILVSTNKSSIVIYNK